MSASPVLRLEEVEEESLFAVCESNLLPVNDEYEYIHHNSIRIGLLKYIEKAP